MYELIKVKKTPKLQTIDSKRRGIALKRLAKMLPGAVLAIFALLIPVTPANAAADYLLDMYIKEDLAVTASMNVPIPEGPAGLLGGGLTCGLLKASNEFLPSSVGNLSNVKIDSCDQDNNKIHLEFSGQGHEGAQGWKITKDEIIMSFPPGIGAFPGESDSSIGGIRITFPGKIKSVEPNVGVISGNSWSIDNPSELNTVVTITASRHGSSLGLILGITIPLVLIIVAVLVAVAVLKNRKNKPGAQPFIDQGPSIPSGQSPMPGAAGMPTGVPRSTPEAVDRFPRQSPMPGTESPLPGTAGIPGGQPPVPGNARPPMPGASPQAGYPPQYGNFPPASYPPQAPQGQPGAPMPGGYYPYPNSPANPQNHAVGNYPYPYPPANPQNPAGGQPPMPTQGYGYGAPAPGFPPPQTPPRPPHPGAAAAPGQPEQPGRPKHAAYSPQPGQSGELGKPE